MGKAVSVGVTRLAAPCQCSVPVFDGRRKSVRRRTLANILHQSVYGFVVEVSDEARFYIGETTRQKERVKHTLQLQIADDPKGVGDRRS